MNTSYDITIVGSGIAGLSTLLYLAETNLYREGKLSICFLMAHSALHFSFDIIFPPQ